MNDMASIIDKLRNWLSGSPGQQPPATSLPGSPTTHAVLLDDAAVEKLMMALSMTQDDEMSCADVFALLDEYAEMSMISEEQAAALMPLVERHLEMCADCHESYDVLRGILQTPDRPTSVA
jgi:hypothetical protein